ncbi:MAG: radical SAM protein [Nitrospinota bacterium]|nr:radical SAM protein [Nitrospinota bacterium]
MDGKKPGHPGGGHPGGHPGTIKDTYKDLKDMPEGVAHEHSKKYMGNTQNQVRLVFWETTAGCNLECIHCRRLDVSKQLMKDDLTFEESKKMIDGIAEMGKPILVLSGGEPLFRPDIFDIAKYASGEKGLTVALATNGTMVDEKMAEKIVESGIQRVSISLDGLGEVHDNFRKLPGSYDRAVKGMKNLQKLGMDVQINCTIAKHNVDQVKDIYKNAVDLGAVALHIFMLVPVGCGVQIADDQMLEPEKYEEVLNWFYDVSMEKKIETKATCAPHYFRIMRERAAADGVTITPKTHGMAAMTKGCLAGSSICFISHKGQVFPCGYLPVEAGNIHRESFKNVWDNSEVFKNLRNPDALKGKCGICDYKTVCEGCRARAFYDKNDYMEAEPYCTYQPLEDLSKSALIEIDEP